MYLIWYWLQNSEIMQEIICNRRDHGAIQAKIAKLSKSVMVDPKKGIYGAYLGIGWDHPVGDIAWVRAIGSATVGCKFAHLPSEIQLTLLLKGDEYVRTVLGGEGYGAIP